MGTPAAYTGPLIPHHLSGAIPSLPILDGTNHARWKEDMEMIFEGCGATWLMGSPAAIRVATIPPDGSKLDTALKTTIWSKVHEDWWYLVRGKKTLMAMIQSISEQFSSTNTARRIAAREAFYRVKHDPSMPLSAYLHSVDATRRALANLKVEVSDTDTLDIILINLDESYATVRTSILSSNKLPTLEDVKAVLLQSSSIIVKTEPLETSFIAQGRRGTSRRGGREGAGSGGSDGSGDPLVDAKGYRWCDPSNKGCHRCGYEGHIAW